MVGRFRSVDVGQKLMNTRRAGFVQVVDDVENDPTSTEPERQVLRADHIGAYITVPLIKNRLRVATLAVHSIRPRAWTSQQVYSGVEGIEAAESLAPNALLPNIGMPPNWHQTWGKPLLSLP